MMYTSSNSQTLKNMNEQIRISCVKVWPDCMHRLLEDLSQGARLNRLSAIGAEIVHTFEQNSTHLPTQEQLMALVRLEPKMIGVCKKWYKKQPASFWLKTLAYTGCVFAMLPKEHRDNEQLLKAALRKDAHQMQHASTRLRESVTLGLWCCTHRQDALRHMHLNVLSNRCVIAQYTSKGYYALMDKVPEYVWLNDMNWTRALIQYQPNVFRFLPQKVLSQMHQKQDLRWWKSNPDRLKAAAGEVKSCKTLARYLVDHKKLECLQYMEEHFSNNPLLMSRALKHQDPLRLICCMGERLYQRLCKQAGVSTTKVHNASLAGLMVYNVPMDVLVERSQYKEQIVQALEQYQQQHIHKAQSLLIHQKIALMHQKSTISKKEQAPNVSVKRMRL